LRIGENVQKEELLHLHMLLVHVKKYYEKSRGGEITTSAYDALGISPVHIHKNKICHKKAILTLGEEIVQHLRQQQPPMVEFSTKEKVAVEQ
jgi:hypothetical protein